MIRPHAPLWFHLRRRVRPESSPFTRRRPTAFPAGLEATRTDRVALQLLRDQHRRLRHRVAPKHFTASNSVTGQTNTISFNIAGTGVPENRAPERLADRYEPGCDRRHDRRRLHNHPCH